MVTGVRAFRSNDGGKTLTQFTIDDVVHVDIHAAVPSPGFNGTTNRTLFLCTDGGLWRTNDYRTVAPRSGWFNLNEGLRTTQFYSIAGNDRSGIALGGTQDNNTLTVPRGTDRAEGIFIGDGGWVAIDPEDPTYVYGEMQTSVIFRSRTGGRSGSFERITEGLDEAESSNGNFIAPLIMDPNKPQVLLAGAASLYRCRDAKAATPRWEKIRDRIFDSTTPTRPVPISAIAVAKGNSDLIWVAYNNGQIFKTRNGRADEPAWEPVEDNGEFNSLPNRYPTRILIDPANAQQVYVTFGGYSAGNLWVTGDGGETWSLRTGTGSGRLPEVPIRAIARKPTNPSILHVGTEIGIFSSSNGGETWTTTNDGPATVAVHDLSYSHGSSVLLAGTFGRGMWERRRPAMLEQISFNRNSVAGGTRVKATIRLSEIATGQGAFVGLQSDNTALARVPQGIFIPGGSFEASFFVETLPTSQVAEVAITATMQSSSLTKSLKVKPPGLTSLEVTPQAVPAGSEAIGRVTLVTPAPTGGTTVRLSTSDPAARVPETVQVGEGMSAAEFPVKTSPLSQPVQVQVKAELSAKTLSTSLALVPVVLTTLSARSKGVTGGTEVEVTASVESALPSSVSLALSNTHPDLATAPKHIIVPAGSLTGTAIVKTSRVSADRTLTLSASDGIRTKSLALTLKPYALRYIRFSPASITGGLYMKGTIALSAPAPSEGLSVRLTPSDSAVAPIPQTVDFPAGSDSVVFAFPTRPVVQPQVVTVTAALGQASVSGAFTVAPSELAKLTVAPVSVKGGSEKQVLGTVTLTGPAAGQGVMVTLSSSLGGAAQVPQSVVIQGGATSATFSVTHFTVQETKSVTLTARKGQVAKAATLTIKP